MPSRSARERPGRVASVAIAAGLALACGTAPGVAGEEGTGPASAGDLARAASVVDELQRARAFDAARRQLEALASSAPPEEAARYRLRRCELFVLAGDRAAARRCALPLSRSGPGEPRALAAWLAATMAADLGDTATAEIELRSLALAAPWTLGAARAVVALQALARERGGGRAEMAALLELAAGLARRPPVPDMEPVAAAAQRELFAGLWVGAGRAALEAGDPARAVAILTDAASPAAGTAWADDAAYRRAQALRASGRLREALAQLEALRDGRIDWPAGGARDSAFYAPALFDIGSILVALGRPDDAIAAWRDLGRRVPGSRLRDDADFEAARLALARGHRELLARFPAEHPESRHVPEALDLLEGHP